LSSADVSRVESQSGKPLCQDSTPRTTGASRPEDRATSPTLYLVRQGLTVAPASSSSSGNGPRFALVLWTPGWDGFPAPQIGAVVLSRLSRREGQHVCLKPRSCSSSYSYSSSAVQTTETEYDDEYEYDCPPRRATFSERSLGKSLECSSSTSCLPPAKQFRRAYTQRPSWRLRRPSCRFCSCGSTTRLPCRAWSRRRPRW